MARVIKKKRKPLQEDENVPKGSVRFTKGDKEVVYSQPFPDATPGKVLKVKFKGGKKPKGKYISEKKAARQIKRKRRRINRRNK
jgi:hypothetical protein